MIWPTVSLIGGPPSMAVSLLRERNVGYSAFPRLKYVALDVELLRGGGPLFDEDRVGVAWLWGQLCVLSVKRVYRDLKEARMF